MIHFMIDKSFKCFPHFSSHIKRYFKEVSLKLEEEEYQQIITPEKLVMFFIFNFFGWG